LQASGSRACRAADRAPPCESTAMRRSKLIALPFPEKTGAELPQALRYIA
jgi:hypothetical protein